MIVLFPALRKIPRIVFDCSTNKGSVKGWVLGLDRQLDSKHVVPPLSPLWWKRGRLSLNDCLTEQALNPNYCISLHCECYISQFWQQDSKHVVLAPLPLPPGEKEAALLSVWAWKKYIIPSIALHCIVNAFLSLQIVHCCPSLPPGEIESPCLSGSEQPSDIGTMHSSILHFREVFCVPDCLLCTWWNLFYILMREVLMFLRWILRKSSSQQYGV